MLEALQKHDAPATCYVIGGEQDVDGLTLSLDEAVDYAIGTTEGTFISCVPGMLGLFEGPGIKSTCLIYKRG